MFSKLKIHLDDFFYHTPISTTYIQGVKEMQFNSSNIGNLKQIILEYYAEKSRAVMHHFIVMLREHYI